MAVFRLVYVSRVSRQVRFADAETIAEDAASSNRDHGITGMLVYSPSHFVQVLEGEESEVRAVLTRISKDTRHFELRVLDARAVPAREFGEWAMVARRWTKPQQANVDDLTPDAALQIVRDARDSEI